jgi:hypothetical protein
MFRNIAPLMQSAYNCSSIVTVRPPVSSSLTLSGGFNVVSIRRLSLSRLAARLRQRLLILVSAFSVFIALRIPYASQTVKHIGNPAGAVTSGLDALPEETGLDVSVTEL